MPLDHSFDEHDAELIGRSVARRCADGIPITVVSDTLTAEDTGP